MMTGGRCRRARSIPSTPSWAVWTVKPFQIDELFELVQRRLGERDDAGAL